MDKKKALAWVKKHVSFPKFARYSIGGVISYLFNIIVTSILTEFFQVHYLSSFIITFTITTIFGFILAVKFIFRVHKNMARKLALYIPSVLALYFVNIHLVKWLVESLGIHYIISITFSTGTLFIAKFLFYDKYVFSDEKQKKQRARAS